ncbi:SpoIIE family protein phosphatase [Nocardioides sp. CPCC 205120]|uniref:SpoIIE family protein phosphatase n=1 Tax=Nocardioides sp. CPCC 205120 TaxID=3406462 RepID=UPI003B50A069
MSAALDPPDPPRSAEPDGGWDDSGEWSLSPCAQLVLDEHLTIRRANAAFVDLVGCDGTDPAGEPAGALAGRSLRDVVSVGGRILIETHLVPMLRETGAVREVFLELVTPAGARVPVLLSAVHHEAENGGGTVRAAVFELRDRSRYEADLLRATRAAEASRAAAATLAATLQATFVPPTPPAVPNLDIAASYRPAGDGTLVGGDFYDVFQLDADTWGIVLGDVSGKGASAAAVTAMVRYTVRALAMQHEDPAQALTLLDLALRRDPTGHFCTLVLARLERRAGHWHLRLALAGHPAPLLRTTDGRVEELGTYGTPVGLMDRTEFHTVEHLLTDETLTFYTDGVTEAQGVGGLLGEEHLARLIAEAAHDAGAITAAVTDAALAYQGGVTADDIAVVTLAPT